MLRILLISLFLIKSLFGYNYNDLILQAEVSIFPKIMLMDKKINNKLIKSKIVYTVVYDKSDFEVAQKVQKYINEKYKGHFEVYPYKVNLVEFSDLVPSTKASALYVLKSSKNNIIKAANIARQKGIVSFSYNIDNLKYGLVFSLVMQKSIVLNLNKEYLNTKSIDFADFLLQTVNFIDKNDF